MDAYGSVENYKGFLKKDSDNSPYFFIGAMQAVLETKDTPKATVLKRAQNLMKAYNEIRKEDQ